METEGEAQQMIRFNESTGTKSKILNFIEIIGNSFWAGFPFY